MHYTIELIGGVRDGDIIAWHDIPPEIHFPVLDVLSVWDYVDEINPTDIVPIRICKYKIISDTLNYFCGEVFRK